MNMRWFGITIENENLPQHVEIRDFVARLFASAHISVAKAKQIIASIGSIDLQKFIQISDGQIHSIVERYNNGLEVEALYSEKMRDWVEHFGQVTDDDLRYLEERFSLKKEFFGKQIQQSIAQTMNSPRAMAEIVKQYVKGQDEAIERIAVPFFQHIESKRLGVTCDIKTSFLLAGNTGTGKSEILRRFAAITDVPVIRINTSECVPNGWRGRKISDFFGCYINNVSDIERLRYSLLIFNEFDKVSHYQQRMQGNSTDYDADMQAEFLKFFDKGFELVVTKQEVEYKLPADDFLLCFDGAFSGIEDIIKKRLGIQSRRIGFTSPPHLKTDTPEAESSLLHHLNFTDLKEWGYIPELLGRIGAFITLNPMSEDIVYEIMTTASENMIDAHKAQCKRHGFRLEFTETALRTIAKMAVESEVGVRSIKTILGGLLNGVYFDSDKYKNTVLTIDETFIKQSNLGNKNRNLTVVLEKGL